MVLVPDAPGKGLAVISIVLLPIAWVTVIARFIVRRKIKALGRDDWLMATGLVFFSLACTSTIAGVYNGVGTHSTRLNSHYQQEGRKWFMLFQLFYVTSTVPIKSSICVVLLRIATLKVYRYPLYAVIVISTSAMIVCDVAVLAQCRPVAATWNKSLGKCANIRVITGVSYYLSASSILTDWTCAILPVFILWDVQLRWRIKAPVAVVLALGVVASSATIIRIKYLLNYTAANNYLYSLANIAFWSIIESGIGIIAGSLATLRPLLKYFPCCACAAPANFREANKRSQKHRGASPRIPMQPSHSTSIESNIRNWDDLSDEASPHIWRSSHISVTSHRRLSRNRGMAFGGPNMV